MIFILYEAFNQVVFAEKFDREFVTLPDGGTMGFDWDGGIPDPNVEPEKPILALVPGVAGDSDNMYQIALIRELRKEFKCVTILLRGAKGVRITSGLLNHPGSWEDIKFCVELLSEKYVKDPKTKQRRTRLYTYGCSMGATILGLYLVHEG